MHDFSYTDPTDMNYALLADRVRYFKEDKKGVQAMCKILEDYGKAGYGCFECPFERLEQRKE